MRKLISILAIVLLSSIAFAADIDEKDFTLKDLDGKAVKLSDFKGKIVVLEWTNYDCPFAKAHYAPDKMTTARLAAKYAGDGVVWLTINSTHYATAEKMREWIKDFDLPQRVLMDPEGKAGKLFGARTTPHIFIIDSSGQIAYQGALDNAPLGKHTGEYINYTDSALGELTSGKAVSTSQTEPYGCSVKYANAEASKG